MLHTGATLDGRMQKPKEGVVVKDSTILVFAKSPVDPRLGLAAAVALVRCRFGGDSMVSLVACGALICKFR